MSTYSFGKRVISILNETITDHVLKNLKNVHVYSFNYSFSSIKMLWVYYFVFLIIRRKIYIFIVIFDFIVEKSSLFYKQVLVAYQKIKINYPLYIFCKTKNDSKEIYVSSDMPIKMNRYEKLQYIVLCPVECEKLELTLYTYKWPTHSIQIIIRQIIRWINYHDRNQSKSRTPVVRTYPRGLRPWKYVR